jgi:hypothetical protein
MSGVAGYIAVVGMLLAVCAFLYRAARAARAATV